MLLSTDIDIDTVQTLIKHIDIVNLSANFVTFLRNFMNLRRKISEARFHQHRLGVILNDTDDLMIIDDLILGSDEESEDEGERVGGSRPGKKPNINRKRQLYSKLIYSDYFCEDPTYCAQHFRRRFRMRLSLFVEIVDDIVQYDRWN